MPAISNRDFTTLQAQLQRIAVRQLLQREKSLPNSATKRS